MASIKMTMTVDDKGLIKNLSKFEQVLQRNVKKEYHPLGNFVKARMKQTILNGINGPSLGVQKYIKGNNKLLVHTRKFANAITYRSFSYDSGLSGISVGWTSGATSTGLSYKKLISMSESGREWIPSEKERLSLASQLKDTSAPKPVGDRKATWRLPPRPFLENIVQDEVILNKFVNVVTRSIDNTLKEIIGK